MTETITRRCGHTTCPPGHRASGCDLYQVRLDPVPSTLLIPLAARAHGGRTFPWLACDDAQAAQLLSCLGTDTAPMLTDRVAVMNVLWRTRVLRQWADDFFAEHPESTGMALGCGLSHHFQWLDRGRNRWIDADLPEVCRLRESLLPSTSSRRVNRQVDLLRPGWSQHVLPSGRDQPVWALCEGVLMYFEPSQVADILSEFADCAPPGSVLVFDAISHVGVGQARHSPSVGQTGAEFRWGVRDLGDLRGIHPGLSMVSTRSVSECFGWWGLLTETAWMPWTGAPLYSMVALQVNASRPSPYTAHGA